LQFRGFKKKNNGIHINNNNFYMAYIPGIYNSHEWGGWARDIVRASLGCERSLK